jgi:hypothetical protein
MYVKGHLKLLVHSLANIVLAMRNKILTSIKSLTARPSVNDLILHKIILLTLKVDVDVE